MYHGLQFAITAVGGLAIGHWLDGRLLPEPLGILGGLFAGAAVGMYLLYRELRKK